VEYKVAVARWEMNFALGRHEVPFNMCPILIGNRCGRPLVMQTRRNSYKSSQVPSLLLLAAHADLRRGSTSATVSSRSGPCGITD
jgi:hypothetical protein